MDDLLKEAIADAKAVRETAIENAKLALEEAFTPTIQSMLSKKLQSEIDGEEEVTEDDEVEEMKMKKDDEDEDMDEMRMKDADEDPSDEDSKEDDDMDEMRMKDEDEEEEEVDESEIIEIDGVKYAPVVDEVEVDEMKMKDEDEEEMEDEKDDEDEMDEELDLEAVIKELESELEEDDEPADEEPVAEGDEEEETVDENDVSSGIGKGDNAHDKKSGSSTDIGKAGKGKMTEGEEEEEVDEEIDLEEILKSLEEENEVEEEESKVETLEAELKEYRDTVEVLRGELSEVNMLNAKLLFTNKLFRAYGLSEAQKVKVIETFDRAKNIREVKLVYSTLAESFGSKNEVVNESVKVKGSASKATASTKSEKTEEVITEGSEMRNRFKKLANIL